MRYSTVDELLDGLKPAARLAGDSLEVTDERLFRGEVVDRLAYSAVFAATPVLEAARWVIWEAAWQLGVQPASIDALYRARAQGAYRHKTVPAINLRFMAYDFGRAVVRAAKARRVGAFIFELAKSEMEYTFQRPGEVAAVATAACIKEGHTGPIFIQADHYQANAKKFQEDPEAVMDELKALIREAIAAGYMNIDIDTSTLVDLNRPTVFEQQRVNFERCVELAALIRELEPEGVTISIGGEIGEVGKKNSTVEELTAFLTGFDQALAAQAGAQAPGLSKISVNTGTSHGGVVLPDGTIADVAIDFDTLRQMSNSAREFGMGGAVQHGASTLPAQAFHKFPEVETLEVHLATEFQNIVLDSDVMPAELRQEMNAFMKRELADEWAAGDTEGQFFYKTRKKTWGPFKEQGWHLPEATRARVRAMLQEKLEFLYGELGVADTVELVAEHVKPVRVRKPMPEVLRAVAVQ